jgi:N-acetylmuramoyl-L-alanine amidase
MNQIVDAMIPYLRASGIDFARSNPGDPVVRSIERSNEFQPDLHLALHSRGTPAGAPTNEQGINVYHFYYSPVNGEKAAYIIAENLKKIYPRPDLVSVVPELNMVELRYTNAPAVLVELGNNDNLQDALWIENNIPEIGRNLALSIAKFLNVPFIEPDFHIVT